MARLAEQDDAGVGEAVERLGEGGIVDIGQRLGGGRESAAASAAVIARASPAAPISGTKRTAPRSSSREVVLAGARDLDQALDRAAARRPA